MLKAGAARGTGFNLRRVTTDVERNHLPMLIGFECGYLVTEISPRKLPTKLPFGLSLNKQPQFISAAPLDGALEHG